MSLVHYRVVCRVCGALIRQCRCWKDGYDPETNTEAGTEYDLCEPCRRAAHSPAERAR